MEEKSIYWKLDNSSVVYNFDPLARPNPRPPVASQLTSATPKPTKVRITDFEESAKLFGSKAKKMSLCNVDMTGKKLGTVAQIKAIEKNYICKKDGVARDTYLLDTVFGVLRFVATDLTVIKPPVVHKKKDRTIKTGVEVRVLDNRLNNLSKEKTYVVVAVRPDAKERKHSTATIIEKSNPGTQFNVLMHKIKRI